MFLYRYHPLQATIQFSHISLVICKLIFLGSADARCIHLLGTILNAYSMFSTSLFMQIIISPVVRWYLKFYFLPKLFFFQYLVMHSDRNISFCELSIHSFFCSRSWLYQYLLIVSGAATCLIYIHRWPTFFDPAHGTGRFRVHQCIHQILDESLRKCLESFYEGWMLVPFDKWKLHWSWISQVPRTPDASMFLRII